MIRFYDILSVCIASKSLQMSFANPFKTLTEKLTFVATVPSQKSAVLDNKILIYESYHFFR